MERSAPSSAARCPPHRRSARSDRFPGSPGTWHRWNDYRALLLYIRQQTNPDTLVANVLNKYPYETINGPTGRLSPFLAESGICWMILVDLDLDSEFADALSVSRFGGGLGSEPVRGNRRVAAPKSRRGDPSVL